MKIPSGSAVADRVPCVTTISGAKAAGSRRSPRGKRDPIRVWSLQEIHGAELATA